MMMVAVVVSHPVGVTVLLLLAMALIMVTVLLLLAMALIMAGRERAPPAAAAVALRVAMAREPDPVAQVPPVALAVGRLPAVGALGVRRPVAVALPANCHQRPRVPSCSAIVRPSS